MSTLKNIRTASLKALVIAAIISLPALASAQSGWSATSNWLQAYYNTLGHQASPAWMIDQSSDAEALYTSEDGKSFALVMPSEINDLEELREELEMPMIEGNGTKLMPTTKPETIAPFTLRSVFAGTIAGQPVSMLCIARWMESGEAQTVLVVCPAQQTPTWETDNTVEFALQLVGQPLNDTLASK